jgi:hypothetical protein
MRNNWNLLIVCFLCVLCFRPYQVNAQVQSQKKITIEISNERLPSVLKRLEKLSGYKILFTYDDVKKFTVSGSVKDKSIEQTLDIILANKPLEYHIEDQFITITSKGPSKQAKVFNVKGVENIREVQKIAVEQSRSLVQPLSSKEVSPAY